MPGNQHLVRFYAFRLPKDVLAKLGYKHDLDDPKANRSATLEHETVVEDTLLAEIQAKYRDAISEIRPVAAPAPIVVATQGRPLPQQPKAVDAPKPEPKTSLDQAAAMGRTRPGGPPV